MFSLFIINCTSTGSNKPRSIDHEEAIIILGGEMGTKKDLNHVTNYFRKNCNYDIYTIFYKSKKGIDQCSNNLKKELSKLPLDKYQKVNFFCFILGGMTLREYLNKNKIDNIGNIVLIKGPIEERLGKVAVSVYPDPVLKVVKGKTLFDLSKIVYNSFSDIDSKIGIIIETEPNKLANNLVKKQKKMYHKLSYSLDNTTFHPDSIFKGHSDFTYLTLDHNEMYQNPQLYLDNVIYFYRNGYFGELADRSLTDYSIQYFPILDKS